MLAPDTLFPVAALLLIVCIHVWYWHRHTQVECQHDVEVDDLTASNLTSQTIRNTRTLSSGVKQLAGRHVEVNSNGDVRGVNSVLFSQNGGALIHRPKAGEPISSEVRSAERHVVRPLICENDLHIKDNVTFHAPLKVGGDLIISGRAHFRAPVTVNGYLNATGTAYVGKGMVVKEDASVMGKLVVGSTEDPSWLVARKLTLGGGLMLNGEIEAVEGVYF